ncbi:hypothetical protein ACM732_27005 [Pseudomonas aeruginosa]
MSKELNKAPVEQAGGDERAKFEYWASDEGIYPKAVERSGNCYKLAQTQSYWMAWQARAALAQPSPKCATCNDSGQIVVSGPHYQGEFQPPEYETEPCDMCAQPSPAQAEVERPEVVARVMHSNPVALDQCAPLNANDELMTVAQHAASVARWAEMFNRVEQERDSALAEVERLTRDRDDCLKARLHYATQHGLSLARVAELTATRNRYGVDAHYFNKNLQRILRDFESFTPDELARSLIILAKVADEKVVAQAQHSVPPGWKLVPIEPTPEMLDARRDCEDGMDGYLVEDTEYYFPDRGAVRDFLACVYHGMLAAAPGKVVGHE